MAEETVKTMGKRKSLKVDRQKFEGIVKNLLDTKPVKRENVKIKNPKNREQLIPPQKYDFRHEKSHVRPRGKPDTGKAG